MRFEITMLDLVHVVFQCLMEIAFDQFKMEIWTSGVTFNNENKAYEKAGYLNKHVLNFTKHIGMFLFACRGCITWKMKVLTLCFLFGLIYICSYVGAFQAKVGTASWSTGFLLTATK